MQKHNAQLSLFTLEASSVSANRLQRSAETQGAPVMSPNSSLLSAPDPGTQKEPVVGTAARPPEGSGGRAGLRRDSPAVAAPGNVTSPAEADPPQEPRPSPLASETHNYRSKCLCLAPSGLKGLQARKVALQSIALPGGLVFVYFQISSIRATRF